MFQIYNLHIRLKKFSHLDLCRWFSDLFLFVLSCERIWRDLTKNKNKRNFFFLSGFSVTNNHESQDCRGRIEEGMYLTNHYHYHPFYRHLGISQAITAKTSPLHIAGNLWFLRASRWATSYASLLGTVAKFSFQQIIGNKSLKQNFIHFCPVLHFI